MHVILVDRRRHRLTIEAARRPSHGLHGFENARTACGHRIAGYYSPVEDKYDGLLCQDGCFTPYELQLAAEIAEAERVRCEAEDARYVQEQTDRARERAERGIEERRRVDIATGKHPRVEPDDDSDPDK